MIIIDSLLAGFFGTIGAMLAFVATVLFLYKQYFAKSKIYTAQELKVPFQEYLEELKEDQKYEEMEEVQQILSDLSEDEVDFHIPNYEIIENPKLVFDENSFFIEKNLKVVKITK